MQATATGNGQKLTTPSGEMPASKPLHEICTTNLCRNDGDDLISGDTLLSGGDTLLSSARWSAQRMHNDCPVKTPDAFASERHRLRQRRASVLLAAVA